MFSMTLESGKMTFSGVVKRIAEVIQTLASTKMQTVTALCNLKSFRLTDFKVSIFQMFLTSRYDKLTGFGTHLVLLALQVL